MYVVKYMHKGKEYKEESLDTREEIYKQYAKEGKVILSCRRKLLAQKVPKVEIIAWLAAMGDLSSTGTHTTKAMDKVIASFSTKSSFPAILKKMRDQVANGSSLAAAMVPYTPVFGRQLIAMIEAGEKTGKMAETFASAAQFIISQDEITKELWKKLTYPAFVFVFGVVSLLFNSMFVIPKLMKTDLFKMAFKGAKSNDPAFLCIKAMKLMAIFVPGVLIFAAAATVVTIIFFKSHQEEVEKRIIALPGIKEFVFYRSYFVAFTSLSKLVSVGVKLEDAFKIVENSTSFVTLQKQYNSARKAISVGKPFTDGLTALSEVEKTMLDTAQDVKSIHRSFESVAKRYHGLYLDKIRSLAPKIYSAVILLVLSIFGLEFAGIMIPYARILNSVHS